MKLAKTLVVLFLLGSTYSCVQKKVTTFNDNYTHVVYFWFHNPDNIQEKTFFEASLTKFLSQSEYAQTNFIGTPPQATREVVDDSFTYNLILTFDSAATQEAYQNEAAHLVFIEECKHLWKKVVVYDANGLE